MNYTCTCFMRRWLSAFVCKRDGSDTAVSPTRVCCGADLETGLAAQMEELHPRHCGGQPHLGDAVRKLHGALVVALACSWLPVHVLYVLCG